MRMFALTFYFVIIQLHIATSVEMFWEVMNAPKYGNLWPFEVYLYLANAK